MPSSQLPFSDLELVGFSEFREINSNEATYGLDSASKGQLLCARYLVLPLHQNPIQNYKFIS